MKVLKLLQELYLELKIYNEHIAEVKAKEEEEKRKRENSFGGWVRKRLKEKKQNNLLEEVNSSPMLCFDWGRKEVSKALGYKSKKELFEAYQQETKGGLV